MSELPESTPAATAPAVTAEPKPYWLYRFAAWVGIVAGIVFIAATVFFAGAKITHRGGWCGHHHHGQHSMMHRAPPQGWPGPAAPRPPAPGPGAPGPSEVPPSASPAPPPPPGR